MNDDSIGETGSKRQRLDSNNILDVAESKPKWTFDKNILYQYLREPNQHQSSIVFSNEKCTVIKDAYPKGAVHLLLIPREDFLNILEVRQLNPSHAEKINELHAIARQIASERECPGVRFRLGYHGIPSLNPLHLHIVSDDFESPSLKHKKHWNSFTSDYFVSIDLVEAWLTSGRSADSQMHSEDEYNAMLSMPLQCHRCKAAMKNIPTLKKHIAARVCTVIK